LVSTFFSIRHSKEKGPGGESPSPMGSHLIEPRSEADRIKLVDSETWGMACQGNLLRLAYRRGRW
jgi:hypothetical protein